MKYLKSIGLGIGFGVLALILMLSLVSAILLSSDITEARITLWSKVILGASAFVSGAISSMVSKKTGWLVGLISGTLLWGIVLGISWLSNEEAISISITPMIIAMIAGLAGGMVSNLIVKRQ